jgi:hypothetical protein
MPIKKQECKYCGKKFHRKGITNHERRCTKRVVDANPPIQAEAVDTQSIHPRVQVKLAVDAYWNMLTLHERLMMMALFEETIIID